jgi:transposase
MEYASRLCRKSPVSEVAEILGHSDSSIREWDKGILENTLPAPDLNNLRVLLVDEKSVRKGHKYVTVVMDGDSREVIHMEEGAKKETLMGFYDRLKPAQKDNIEAVGLDRGGAYLSATREALPKADIVFDKFHLIQNLNAALDDVRRTEYREALRKGHPSAGLIKGQRYNLLRLPENRTKEQSLRLEELLKANAVLSKAHLLSEELRVLWTYGHRGDAEQFLANWVKMVEESDIWPLVRYARGLWRHREGILNYVRHNITSGPLEAMNGTIERVIRRGCGVRDIRYLYLKVRQESLDRGPA